MDNTFDEDAISRLLMRADAEALRLGHQPNEWRRVSGSFAHGAQCNLCLAWGFVAPGEKWRYGPLLHEECSATQPSLDRVPLGPLAEDEDDDDYRDLYLAGNYSSRATNWLVMAALLVAALLAGLVVAEMGHLFVLHLAAAQPSSTTGG